MIFAIIRFDQAHPNAIRQLIRTLTPQVDTIIVVGRHIPLQEMYVSSVKILYLQDPCFTGTAEMRNAAADCALADGASWLLFFDQDCFPGNDYVANLKLTYQRVQSVKGLPALVAPSLIDQHTHEPYKMQSLLIEYFGPYVSGVTQISQSSFAGVIIRADAYEQVGHLREDWVESSVENEWCYRARMREFGLFLDEHTKMEYKQDPWMLAGWKMRLEHLEPKQFYYHIRNRLLLMRVGYTPFRWKLYQALIFPVLFHFALYPGKHRLRRFAYMLKGLVHGLLKKTGPLPE